MIQKYYIKEIKIEKLMQYFKKSSDFENSRK
jgi:hypothetical protein